MAHTGFSKTIRLDVKAWRNLGLPHLLLEGNVNPQAQNPETIDLY